MFVIQESVVEPAVAEVQFACDLKECHGACCTIPGGTGAPLLDEEVDQIRRAFPVVRDSLPAEHRAVIDAVGLVEGEPGNFTTPCYNNRACVFVVFEGTTAKCSFEREFWKGNLSFRKPLSCQLFPIRIDRFGTERVRFEYIAECQPGLERGAREGIQLSDFLRDALIRAYGNPWYEEFRKKCDAHNNALSPSRDAAEGR